jgi:hypothetical protein
MTIAAILGSWFLLTGIFESFQIFWLDNMQIYIKKTGKQSAGLIFYTSGYCQA